MQQANVTISMALRRMKPINHASQTSQTAPAVLQINPTTHPTIYAWTTGSAIPKIRVTVGLFSRMHVQIRIGAARSAQDFAIRLKVYRH